MSKKLIPGLWMYGLRLLLLGLLVGIGLYSKFYRGWNEHWVNNSLGGVFYVVFWCGVWDLLESKRSAKQIALFVFLITCGLEFLQLYRNDFLDWVRGSFVGRTLLGTTFAASDFFYYFIGSLLGYYWVCSIRRLGKPHL